MNAKPTEIDAITERMTCSEGTGGGEINSSWGGEHVAGSYYPGSEKIIYKSKMSGHYSLMITRHFLDILVAHEFTTGPLMDT